MPTPRQRLDVRRALLHPAFWGSLAVLLLNDHVLKYSDTLPSALTGKVSDFAGLMVAPVVLAAALGARHRNLLLLCHVFVGIGFALINISAPAAQAVVDAMGLIGISWKIWCDPTDLMALPMLWVSLRVFAEAASREKALRAPWGRSVATMGFAVGMIGSVASSRAPPVRVAADAAHVYVPARTDETRAVFLDVRTGKEVMHTDAAIASFPRGVAVNGTLVAPSGVYFEDGAVVGIDTKTGMRKFQLQPTRVEGLMEMRSSGETVIFTRSVPGDAQSTELVGMHAQTGRVVWKRPVVNSDRMPIHVRDDVVLFADGERLTRLGPSGTVVWSLALPDDAVSITSMKGRAYVQLDNELILVVNLDDGKTVLRREIPANTFTGWTTGSGSLTASTTAVFLDTPEGVMVLDEELRVRRTVRRVSRPYAEGDTVVALAGDYLYRLDPTTGALMWRYQKNFWADTATLTDDTVVLGGDDEIVALDVVTGVRRWRWVYPHARE